MNTEDIIRSAVLALAVANVSLVLTKAGIFAWYREFFERRFQAAPEGSRSEKFWHFFAELTSCPWCTSHWITFAVIAIYQPRPVRCGWWFVDLVVAAFVVVTLNAWFAGLIHKAYASMSSHSHGEEE
jgi:hypothetical protein